MESIKPIQIAKVEYKEFCEARKVFTASEWIDLLLQSIGFEPTFLGHRSKLLQLMRLIPFVERNYNLIELGPKGTGKSHIYSEFSPHGQLISGGEVTVPKLFVNNNNGRIGLVGFWDVVAFDEFAGQQKTANKVLVDIMKNYMANKTFSRGVNPMGAEASFVFVGNTAHNVPFMLKNSDLFEVLPAQFHDSAFIDRLHAYLPGWEFDIIRSEMFTSGYGFIVDYLAEIFRLLRTEDFSNRIDKSFEISRKISTRDRDGIYKTTSGLLKLIFPNKDESEEELKELFRLAIECRKRVRDQLVRIDQTYQDIEFTYQDTSHKVHSVFTVEEEEFPQFYKKSSKSDVDKEFKTSDEPVTGPSSEIDSNLSTNKSVNENLVQIADSPDEGHHVYSENRKGVSYSQLFGPYLDGSTKIVITDPYIRQFFQIRNLMELIEVIIKRKPPDENISIHLITETDEKSATKQTENFNTICSAVRESGIDFTWEIDQSGSLHARHIVSDSGWKISLDRGLDIFQQYAMNDAFSLTNRLQEHRSIKQFEITYIQTEKS